MPAPAPGRRRGQRQAPFRRCRIFALLDANAALAACQDAWRIDERLADAASVWGDATPVAGQSARPDLVVASYVDRRTRRRARADTRRPDVGEDARHAAGGRAGHARRLRAHDRAARETDRSKARMFSPPARTTPPARWLRRTGAISRSGCRARASICCSRTRTFRSRMRNSLCRAVADAGRRPRACWHRRDQQGRRRRETLRRSRASALSCRATPRQICL